MKQKIFQLNIIAQNATILNIMNDVKIPKGVRGRNSVKQASKDLIKKTDLAS